jgi:hypothetical protein
MLRLWSTVRPGVEFSTCGINVVIQNVAYFAEFAFFSPFDILIVSQYTQSCPSPTIIQRPFSSTSPHVPEPFPLYPKLCSYRAWTCNSLWELGESQLCSFPADTEKCMAPSLSPTKTHSSTAVSIQSYPLKSGVLLGPFNFSQELTGTVTLGEYARFFHLESFFRHVSKR